MKRFLIYTLLFSVFSLYSFSLSAQKRKCKVLLPGINKSYKGKCKKGLAHGKGFAKGVDTYKGSFREGLPHGSGTYTYSTGEVYVGRWKEGMKHGGGRYSFQIDDKDTTTVGIWENDVYIGPDPGPPYKIKYKLGVERDRLVKNGDGDRVMIEFMLNGMRNDVIEQLRIQSNTGRELKTSIARGYEVVEFPFTCRLSYITWNKMKTRKIDVVFDFEINEPGDWSVIIHN